jgi:hypothetical protein
MSEDTVNNTGETNTIDEAWLAAPTKRSRLSLTLAVLLAAAVCFLGGSLTQRHFGAEPVAADGTAGVGGLPAGVPEGFPGGGFPGSGAGAEEGEPAAPADEDSSDSVIGTVVEIRDGVWVVEDLGGERHEVAVAEDTSVTRETSITTGEITSGDRVQITGTTLDDQLHADQVTQR